MNDRRAMGVLFFCLFFSAGAQAADTITFSEFYLETVRGLKFSPKLTALAGKTVTVVGAMAPPLRASGHFLVLTKDPVSLCPYCQSDADWPADIMVVYLKKETVFIQKNRPLAVTGILEIGSHTDPETGFVSQVRLVNASYQEQ